MFKFTIYCDTIEIIFAAHEKEVFQGIFYIIFWNIRSKSLRCMQFFTWEIANVIYYGLGEGRWLSKRPRPGRPRHHGNSGDECPVWASLQQEWNPEWEPEVQH